MIAICVHSIATRRVSFALQEAQSRRKVSLSWWLCFCPDDIDPDILESLITMIQAMFTLVAIHSAIMDGTSQMQQLFAGN